MKRGVDMAEQQPQPRKLARAIVLAFAALLVLFWAVVLFTTWASAHAMFGWNLGPDGKTLTYIVPNGPAARAGLRAGDRIDWSTLPLVARANLAIVEAVTPGVPVNVTVYRGTAKSTARVVPVPWPPVFESASRALTLAGLFLGIIGIALVYIRPSRMTWGFLLASLLWAYPTNLRWLWAQGAPWKFAIAEPAAAILLGAYAAGILTFMSRFPSDHPQGPLRTLDRLAVPFGVLVAALALYVDFDILFSASPPAAWALFATQSLIQVVLFALALAALMTTYVLTKSSDRHRIVPVLIAFGAYVAFTMTHNVYSAFFTDPNVTAVQYILIAFSMVALALAVAHGVVTRRVFDVSFAISRTLVYTVLTSFMVGVFVLVDFVSSKLLDRFQITAVIEAVVALAFGIWLNALHAHIDRFLDGVLFRRRHLAEARLERVGRALPHAKSVSFIDDALVIETCDAFGLGSAALFRRDQGTEFVRVLSRGWSAAERPLLAGDDHLVIHLASELQSLDLAQVRWPHEDVPHGIAQPILAVPLCVRHELIGLVLYGAHVGGEAIDPDERRTLTRLADAAAAAYEHIQAQALASQLRDLQAENAMLAREQRVLRETLDRLGNLTRSAER